jgi:hypothetical protein
MFDALMYVKAGRALQVPVALEVSRSGVGAHAWVFFTSPVPAEMARRPGDRPAAGGDGAARADEPGQLRPTVPVPGPAPGRPDDFYAALTARGKAARSQYNAAHTPPLTTETYTGGLLPGREDELRWKAEHAVRCGTPPARNRVLPAARVAP